MPLHLHIKYHDIVVKAKALGWIANVTFFTDNTAEETTERRQIREVVDLERYHTQHLGKDGTHQPFTATMSYAGAIAIVVTQSVAI